ncbi:MAG: ATP-binding protein [Elusimicrobiales bacterium]
MKQVLILSGKGGTGKTTVSGAFARLAAPCVTADCDVDAADLHIILSPEPAVRNDYFGGKKASIDPGKCVACGRCLEVCRFDAVTPGPYNINQTACEGCGVCVWNCPAGAITSKEVLSGTWAVSPCRFGTFAGARLEPAEENSGKLVALLKAEAVKVAETSGAKYLILDGSPGIGCPVLAALGGVDAVVLVAEPTVSGRHDFMRLAELLKQQKLKGFLLVNKWDLNEGETAALESAAADFGFVLLGRMPFDTGVIKTLLARKTLGEDAAGPAAAAVEKAWRILERALEN